MTTNRTLQLLSAEDRLALEPHLKERQVARGEVLIRQGEMIEHIHFPVTAHVSNEIVFDDGASSESFVMGVEGVTGLAPFLANEPCVWNVEVKSPGVVYELPADVLRVRMHQSPALLQILLKRTHDYQSQAATSVACSAHHDVTSRLAKVLIAHADRTTTERMQMTQADLASLLGVQRTSVNKSARELRAAGAIRYSRGAVTITDRGVLERLACECYRRERRFRTSSVPEAVNGSSV